MRKLYLLTVTVLFAAYVNAQNVRVTPNPVDYVDVREAFNAINAGTHIGDLLMEIKISTTETGTATLNASGTGPSSFTSLAIRPSGIITVSGAMLAGSPLLDLNGADNVTIDGLNTVGNSLTFSNTTVSATAGTSTIMLRNGATNNMFTNLTVLGSFSGPVTTVGGNIYIGPDAFTPNGNDNNTVSFNIFGPAGLNLPTKGISSSGSTSTSAINNSGLNINNNLFRDIFSSNVSSSRIDLGPGTTDVTVSNNKLFQSASRTFTAGVPHFSVRIDNPSGNNFQIINNTIGFGSSAGTGTSDFVFAPGSSYVPISLNVGTTTATSVQGNTIAGIAMSGAGSGTGDNAPFRAISFCGLVNIGNVTGNTIGSQSTTNSITYTSSSTGASDVTGIHNAACNQNVWIANNTIGGITAGNSSTGASNISGIRINNPTAILNVTNNIIGGNVANSLQSTSTSFSTNVVGIFTNASNSIISRNRFRNFIATGPARVTGIEFNGGAGTNLIDRNEIFSFNTGNFGELNGILANSGTATFQNMMTHLGIDALGNSITGPIFIHGIQELGGTNNFWFNSVYIGGAGVTGTANSAAFYSIVTNNTRNYQNNILVNARSNGTGTGTNWAIVLGGSGTNPPGLTSNYNDLYAPGNGGSIGFYNGMNRPTLAAWRTATGQDNNSVSGDPQFNNPATGDLHIHPTNPTVVEGKGLFIASVTDDYDGQSRAALTPTDIGADAGNFVALAPLAVTLLNFSGYKQGNVNILRWTTANENNNLGFEAQRSNDGIHYSPIGFVNTRAPGGNSNDMLNYMFTDNNPGLKQYYRLRPVDIDSQSKLSTVVLIRGEKPVMMTIGGLLPNPANSIVNVNIEAPGRKDVTLVVTDIAGRIVIQKPGSVETGSNTIPIDVSKLTRGSYLVKLVCEDNCETVVSKFIKQ